MEISVGTSVIIVLSSIGVIIAVVEIIGKHLRSLREEFKNEIQTSGQNTNAKIDSYIKITNDKIDLYFNKIGQENAELRGYIFNKPAEDKKTC